MRTQEELFVELREKGFRLTTQRERIIDIFYKLPEGEHLTAEELFLFLQKENADISLATLYRTLKMLTAVGVLRELDFAEDHKHYELASQEGMPHHHVVCLDCGAMAEFDSTEVFVTASCVADKMNLDVADVQLKVFGKCKAYKQFAQQAQGVSTSGNHMTSKGHKPIHIPLADCPYKEYAV